MALLPLWASDRQVLVELFEHMLVLEAKMSQGFADLQAAVDALSGEGGEITQAKDAILGAIGGLQSVVSTLQSSLANAQAAVDAANQQLADAGVTAGTQADTLNTVKDQFDDAEQQLNAAAAALQNPTP